MDDDLRSLRAQALARHVAATRKVQRNERKGVGLWNTKYDIRRDPANIARYNKKQLTAYIAKLDQFVSRKTQFVPDMKGRPLPVQEFRKLKAAERKFNAGKLSRAAAVGGIMLPPIVDEKGGVVAQQTVKERRDVLPTKRPRGSNPAINNPWEPKNFQPWQVNGEGALDRLTKMLRDRATPEGQLKEYKAQLKAATKMLNEVGAKDLAKRVRAMDMDKFYILFNHSGFVHELSTDYEIVKSKDPHIEADFNGARETAKQNAGRLIGWAEKQRLGS